MQPRDSKQKELSQSKDSHMGKESKTKVYIVTEMHFKYKDIHRLKIKR